LLVAALNFPPIGELVDWKKFGPLGLNKPALIAVVATVMTLALFFLAGARKSLVPTGVQNVAEATIDFVRDGIIMQTMGPDGMVFLPYLTTLFCFILFCNIFEIVPFIQFPATARMAIPLFLALFTWVLFNFMGIKRQGFFGYMKSSLFPPGVAVRLFANELAGHLLLVTFAVLTDTLLFHNSIVFFKPIAVLPAVMDVALTGFEVLVAFLQAFIVTILTAVYLGGSMHPEH
jgi:F-type H+-transporting ATPase subunit a